MAGALVTLVLERGYDDVTVEDIVCRADVARATFYSHFKDKEDLLSCIFSRLMADLGGQLVHTEGPWNEIRTSVIEAAYRHADGLRDIYRICLGGAGSGSARRAYEDVFYLGIVRNFSDRIAALETTPRVPVTVMARAAAGTHVALLEAWINGQIDVSLEEMVKLELALMVYGHGWGHGMDPSQIKFFEDDS